MIGFKHLKIGSKAILLSTLLFSVVLSLISFSIAYQVEQFAEKMAEQTVQKTVERYTNALYTSIGEPLHQVQVLSDTFQSILNIDVLDIKEQHVDKILKDFIHHHPDYLGVWLVLDVDEKNTEQAWRFNSYWVLDVNKFPKKEPAVTVESMQTGDYYQIPKRTLQATITDPFLYPVQGEDVLMSTIATPLLNKEGQFMGITSIDIELKALAKKLKEFKNIDFNNIAIDFYSSNGTLVSGQHKKNIGKNIKEIENADFAEAILEHQSFSTNRFSEQTQETMISYVIPVSLGSNSQKWMIAIHIPEQELYSMSRQTLTLIGASGVLGIILIIFSMYFFVKSFMSPLLRVNRQLNALSLGKTLNDDDIEYHAEDEIAESVSYTKKLKHSMNDTIQVANSIASGDYTQTITLLSEEDQLGRAITNMTISLREAMQKNQIQDWFKSGQAKLADEMSGEQDIIHLAEKIINFLVPYLESHVGIFYIYEEEKEPEKNNDDTKNVAVLRIIATHAYVVRRHFQNDFCVGQGIVGQAALERRLFMVTDVPEGYMPIQSGVGESTPKAILVMPLLHENEIKGVIEIASLQPFSETQLEFLNQIKTTIATAVHTAEAGTKVQKLLEQSQHQADELREQSETLQAQQQELKQTNEELQAQSEELQAQQEELRQVNEELETRTLDLEKQREEIKRKNDELQNTQEVIETKAKELELASKYKSEFLANMSHELRTPLNSMLILAQLLEKNKDGNLSEKQMEYAQTIYNAGSDLLNLINEILDLSKVEAGRLEANITEIILPDLIHDTENNFRHVAAERKLDFHINVDNEKLNKIYSDEQRLKQIINNLLSNAFKFTAQGSVSLIVQELNQAVSGLALKPGEALSIQVKDTGIGIPEHKQSIIFEAFQQADGTTSRKYGGTGLGLAISRQLSRLLGGDLRLHSAKGEGCTFNLYLPKRLHGSSKQAIVDAPRTPTVSNQKPDNSHVVHPTEVEETEIHDDREQLKIDAPRLLIIEDDKAFSQVLLDLAHERDFSVIVAGNGKTGLEYATTYRPNAIILDLGLPQMDGLSVMEALKDNVDTRHIPVHFISASDETRQLKNMGAIGYILKPVNMHELSQVFTKIQCFINKKVKNALIFSDIEAHFKQIEGLIKNEDAQIKTVQTVEPLIEILKTTDQDMLIIDAQANQHSSLDILERFIIESVNIPIIIYSEQELTEEEEEKINKTQDKLTIKAVRSEPRLLDETTLFLHSVENKLPEEKQKLIRMVHDKDALFKDKKIFVIDDDMRNTFALTTTLEDKDMEVLVGNNGKEALSLLEQYPDVDLILMDIMMPQMDGYETMRTIREHKNFRHLPIIALTAKAMKDDKRKCLEAGANDYLSKPVDIDKLLSLMRVWLYQ